MPCCCRSHHLGIWCCAILLVFSSILFGLLDIDGAPFERSPGSCTAAMERLIYEDGGRHVAFGVSHRLAPAPTRSLGDGRIYLPAACEGPAPLPSAPHVERLSTGAAPAEGREDRRSRGTSLSRRFATGLAPWVIALSRR
jgi:hypothetical protein